MPDDSNESSNTPQKTVNETNGTPGPSHWKPEEPSDQDRPESVPRDGEDDMAMIQPFHEEQPLPRDSGESTSQSEDCQESHKGSPKQVNREQHHPSTVRNGNSEGPSTQNTTELAGVSTLRNFDFMQRLDPQSLELMGFPASRTSVATTPPAQAGQTATSGNRDSQDQDPQNTTGATSQSNGMSFIHPFDPDMFNQGFPRTDSK